MRITGFEKLVALACLYSAGFDVWDDYSKTLDSLFEKYPNDDTLLALEFDSDEKNAVCHTLKSCNMQEHDIDRFGAYLMGLLEREYRKEGVQLIEFSNKAYAVWQSLTSFLPFDLFTSYPFHVLSYADDSVNCNCEEEGRRLYEDIFDYYIIKKRGEQI